MKATCIPLHNRLLPGGGDVGVWAIGSRKRAIALREVVALCLIAVCVTALLVPATANVRHNSKAQRCLSNLAQIGYANIIYASLDENDNALPVHHKWQGDCSSVSLGSCFPDIFVGAYEWGGKSGVGQEEFLTGSTGNKLGSRYGTGAGFGPASRPLNAILYPQTFQEFYDPDFRHGAGFFDRAGATEDTLLDLPAHRCPSDTGFTGMHCPRFEEQELSSYDHFGTSYNANIFMTARSGGGPKSSSSPYLHRMSDLRAPERTLAYQENCGRFAWTALPDQCSFIEGIPGTARGWHGKDWTFNAAFIDGHADTIYMRGYRSENVFFDDPFLQANLNCVIIRGEHWQLDVFPVQSVPTGIFFSGLDGRPSYEGCVSPN